MKEKWQKVDENKRSEYYVSSEGRCKRLNKITGEEEISLGGFNSKLRYYQFAGNYVHRHVATAFVPNPDNKPWVDHINSNTFDNRAENLRWTTTQENNSTDHSKMMRSINAWFTNRRDEVIIATKGDQTKLFKNGQTCAKELGVSTSFVYNCLNNRGTACKVKGWNLKWISKQSDEAAPLTQALEKEKEARKLARQQRLDEIRAEHKAATKNRREERMRKKQISKLEKKIATWKKHLEAIKSKEKIEQKIRELEAQKRVFEEKCI